MNGLCAAACEAEQLFRSKGWRYCIIGGLAVVRWGIPRLTQDVDFSLLAEFGKEQEVVDELLAHFPGRIHDARDFALQNRVVLCNASSGVPLDIALAGFPFEEQVIARATPFAFEPGVTLVTASAEDLIVLKAFAGRDQDWGDVRGIMERQFRHLDWDLIVRELTVLRDLQTGPDPLPRLEEIRQQTASRVESSRTQGEKTP